MPNGTVHEQHFDQLNTATFLAVTLVIVQIGIIKCFRGVPSSARSFLAGDRDSSVFAVCTSIAIQAAPHALVAVTWAFLPGLEVVHLASAFGVLIAGALTVLLFTPIMYHECENSISLFAYLENRFNTALPRRLVGLLHVTDSCVMIAIHVYTPSLTISEVTGIPVAICMWLIILGIFASSVLSGNRGLLWTNFVQMVFFLGALIAVLVEANHSAGAANENASNHLKGILNKLNGWIFTASLAAWGAHWTLHFVSHQSFTQRTASARSRTEARLSVGAASIIIFLLLIIGSLVGSSLKGAHARQHLSETQRADRSSDQVIYFFVKQAYGHIPGIPGLLMGMLFSAYIGCAASLCNAVTSVLFEDFIEPCLESHKTQRFRLLVAKYSGLAPLIISAAVALVTYLVGIQPSILLNLTAIVGGPIVSFFSLGLLSSKCSLKASMCGLAVGMVVAFVASGIFFEESSNSLNHTAVFAAFETGTNGEESTGKAQDTSLREWFHLWSASLVWVELLAFCVSILITMIVSPCTQSSNTVDSDLACHVASRIEMSDTTRRSRQESNPAIDLTRFRGTTELKTPD